MIQVLLWSKNIAWNSTNYIKPSIPFESCMNTELAMVISTEVYIYGHIQHFYILLHGLCIQFMGSGGENIVLVTRLVTSLDTLHSGVSYREKEKEGKSSCRNN